MIDSTVCHVVLSAKATGPENLITALFCQVKEVGIVPK
jgi:hypothetical protein